MANKEILIVTVLKVLVGRKCANESAPHNLNLHKYMLLTLPN